MENHSDILYSFAEHYERGEFIEALRLILSPPQRAYSIATQEDFPIFPKLVNYADAAVNKAALIYRHTSQILQRECIEQPKPLNLLLEGLNSTLKEEYLLCVALLDLEKNLASEHIPEEIKNFAALLNQAKTVDADRLEEALNDLSQQFRQLLRKRFDFAYGLAIIQEERPNFISAMAERIDSSAPWHLFTHEGASVLSGSKIGKATPVVFLEPYEELHDPAVLEEIAGKPAIFTFPTVTAFCQYLPFRSLDRFWKDPRVLIYIMELYPQQQLLTQGSLPKIATLEPLWLGPQNPYPSYMLPLLAALKDSINSRTYEGESAPFNTLYAVSKRALADNQARLYGLDRAISLSIEKGLLAWHDPHRASPLIEANLGPPPCDYMEMLVAQAEGERAVRGPSTSKKIRLAHIVPQIVDNKHAPTKLLRNLLAFANRDKFDLFVISTERMTFHPYDYPIATLHSLPSTQRGKSALETWRACGIWAYVLPEQPTFKHAIENVLLLLDEQEIDIAVFHGPDELNTLIAASSSVPKRVFFDHGTLPTYGCYDLAIISTEGAWSQNRERFKEMGMDSVHLTYCIDSREEWLPMPFTRSQLGLPEKAFVMTTISNHLDSRLTSQMCDAVGKILKRCPQAVYAPIGAVAEEPRLRSYFEKYGVNNRVYFLGSCKDPSQMARTMHLYLNEFPFGSGLAILDAMAAGCPVVSMYDPHGPQQACYGGIYYGLDRVITSGKTEDYVLLASRLIEDPYLYKKWSDDALDRYASRVDIKGYVSHFEEFMDSNSH